MFVARLNYDSEVLKNCKYKIRDFFRLKIENLLKKGGEV